MARDVVFVVFEGLQSLDLVGPLEVLAAANDQVGRREYRSKVASLTGRPVTTSSGLHLGVDAALGDGDGRLDTLVVAGGAGTAAALADRDLITALRRLARRSSRITSVCSGAFLLAEAGLLHGRRATTHWTVCELLAQLYPEVKVDPDPILVRDGAVITSAGVTAGMDLALALVEEDLGRDVALAVARRLVLFLHRPANQAQLSATLASQLAERSPLRAVQVHIAEHPGDDLRIGALARRAALSERHFTRCFTDEVGVTPARYVERVRVEAARRLLEDTADGVGFIAATCGFGTAETMRRSFLRILRVSPTEYRRRFAAA